MRIPPEAWLWSWISPSDGPKSWTSPGLVGQGGDKVARSEKWRGVPAWPWGCSSILFSPAHGSSGCARPLEVNRIWGEGTLSFKAWNQSYSRDGNKFQPMCLFSSFSSGPGSPPSSPGLTHNVFFLVAMWLSVFDLQNLEQELGDLGSWFTLPPKHSFSHWVTSVIPFTLSLCFLI